MEHNHTHEQPNSLNTAFKIGIFINIIFVAVEFAYGFLSNSMALVADAGHNLSDVFALAFSWIAIILSQRKPTLKFTYGLRRSTILIAILNSILLLIAVGVIIWETIHRFGKPVQINSHQVIIVAIIGILINGITAWLFMKDKKHDLNIRSVFVHFVGDALVSLGVLISGVIIAYTNIVWIDTLVSCIIIAVILYNLYHLLIESIDLALDAVPVNIDIQLVKQFLEDLPEVSGVHDLHIWALSTTEAALTVHLSTQHQTGIEFITGIQQQLHERFKIAHTTIQVELNSTICDNCCN